MTREEAIEQLKWYFEYDNGLSADKETVEAYKTAIQALSQEPTDENLHREREQAYMQGYEDASKRFRQEPTVCDIDAIRAEIDGIEINGQIDEHTSFIRTGEQVKKMALEIISKFTKGE